MPDVWGVHHRHPVVFWKKIGYNLIYLKKKGKEKEQVVEE